MHLWRKNSYLVQSGSYSKSIKSDGHKSAALAILSQIDLDGLGSIVSVTNDQTTVYFGTNSLITEIQNAT